MIDEKKIEEAAEEYGKKKSDEYSWQLTHESSFKAGINWFKENLWHDASEEPEPSTARLLGITKDDEVKMMYSTHEKEYEGDTEGYWLFHDEEGNTYNPFYGEVKKWLYIEDLMKGGE